MNRFWKSIIHEIFKEIKPKKIVEVGSDKGINTKNILQYCKNSDAKLISIDPAHRLNLNEIKKEFDNEHTLIEDLSLNVLPNLNDYDVIMIDGDHNWYTVYNELKIIEKQFNRNNFPFIIFHDVGWPYGRRDMYYSPDSIPKKYRLPYKKLGMYPDKSELLTKGGLNHMLNNATKENTAQNGVKTAIEDFINQSQLNLTFKTVDTYNGLGLLFLSNSILEKKINIILEKSDIYKLSEKENYKHILNLENALISKNEQIEQFNQDNINLKNQNNLKDQTISNQQDTITILSNQINNLINEKNILAKNNSEYENNITLLNEKLSHTTNLIDKHEKNISEHLETINLLQSENKLLISKKQDYEIILHDQESLIRTIKSEKDTLQIQYKNIVKEDKILKYKNDSLKKSSKYQLDLIKEQNEKIKKFIDKENKEIYKQNELSRKNNLLNQEIKQFKINLLKAQEENKKLKTFKTDVLKSNSWKLTGLLRKFGLKFKHR